MARVGKLKDGSLMISGELNERSPSVKNGLVAYQPFDLTDEGYGNVIDGLICHWKLDSNGDFNDYSFNENDLIHADNSGGLIVPSTSGRVGAGCYERTALNTNTDYLRSANKVNLTESFTMSCWAYVMQCHAGTANGLVTNHNHATNQGAGITVKHISDTDFRISCNTGSGSSRTYHSYYGTTNIKDKWSHLTVRFDKTSNTLSLWVNGEKEWEGSYAMSAVEDYIALFSWSLGYNTSSNYRPKCKIDDVRIYNRALSDKELGMIYSFSQPSTNTSTSFKEDGSGIGVEESTQNLETDPIDFMGYSWGGSQWITTSVVDFQGRTCLKIDVDCPPDQPNWVGTYGGIDVAQFGVVDDWFTRSCWMYVVPDGTHSGSRPEINATHGGLKNGQNTSYDTSETGVWKHLSASAQIGDPTGNTNIYFYLFAKGANDPTHIKYTMYIWHPQLEKKRFSTVFTDSNRGTGNLEIPVFAGKDDVTVIFDWTPSEYSDNLADYQRLFTMNEGGSASVIFSTYRGVPYLNGNSFDGSNHNVHQTFNSKRGVSTKGVIKRSGNTMWLRLYDGVQDVTWQLPRDPSTDVGLANFNFDSIVFLGQWGGVFKNISMYNRLLSDEDIDKIINGRLSFTDDGNIINVSIKEYKTKTLIEEEKRNVFDNTYKSTGGWSLVDTDVSEFVESDNTLGNTVIVGEVYLSDPSIYPTRFEYTKDNNTKGLIGYLENNAQTLRSPLNWVQGWNTFYIHGYTYADEINTPWADMTRLEIYRSGLDVGVDTTQYFTMRNVRLVKLDYDKSKPKMSNKDGVIKLIEFKENQLL